MPGPRLTASVWDMLKCVFSQSYEHNPQAVHDHVHEHVNVNV